MNHHQDKEKVEVSDSKYPYQNFSLKDIEGEAWQEIISFEGYYMISNLGRIKSLERTYVDRWGKDRVLPSQIRKQDSSISKSLSITLHISGEKHKLSIARLVFSHFVHPIPYSRTDRIVSHKNNDPEDNRAENLELSTQSDFSRRQILEGISFPIERIALPEESRERIRRSRCKSVSQFTVQGKFIRSYESLTEAFTITGVQSVSIQKHIEGEYKSAGGYLWRLGTSQKPLSKKQIRIYQNRRTNAQRPVEQLDLAGNHIKTYPSMAKAAQVANIATRSFSYELSKSRSGYIANGYLWRLVNMDN